MMVLTPARDRRHAGYVLIYNNDGSLAGACGNGTRCVADRLARETRAERFDGGDRARPHRLRAARRSGPIASTWGRRCSGWRDIPLAREADTVAVDIPGAEAFGPAGLVNMGNPHAVFFVADLDAVDLAKAGPPLEHHPLFPEKANISFAQILCAAAYPAEGVGARRRGDARLRLGRLRDAGGGEPARPRRARGGDRTAGRRADNSLARDDSHVLMTGPVEFEREIELAPTIFA